MRSSATVASTGQVCGCRVSGSGDKELIRKEKQKAYSKLYYSKPENKQKRREYTKLYYSNPENKMKQRLRMKLYHQNKKNITKKKINKMDLSFILN